MTTNFPGLLGGIAGLPSLIPQLDPCFAGGSYDEKPRFQPIVFSMIGSGGGGGTNRKGDFDDLFSRGVPPNIHDPSFVSRVRRLAPPSGLSDVKILYKEGSEEPVPSARFVSRIPQISVQALAPLVDDLVHEWHEWVPMVAAMEVHDRTPHERGGFIQRLIMTMEGTLAQMSGIQHVDVTTHIMTDRNHEGVVQSRWDLVDGATGTIAINRGSWTFVPDSDDVLIVYEGLQVPRFVAEMNRFTRGAAVLGLKRHARGQLPMMVEHLVNRASDRTWTKRSAHRPRKTSFTLSDV
jgi:hypothetical protein